MAKRKQLSFIEKLGNYSWIFTILISLGVGGFGSYVTSRLDNKDRDHRITAIELSIAANQRDAVSPIAFALEQQKLNTLIAGFDNTKKETNAVLSDLTKRLSELEGTLKSLNLLLDRLERRESKQ